MLAEKLLQKLNDWKPAGSGRQSWIQAFAPEGWTVTIIADAVDSLSCLVWELDLTRTTDTESRSIQQWAAAIASRATGLLEPLTVHEIDATQGVALLRSNIPARKGEALAYYEVMLKTTGQARVRRYVASRSASGREQVAFALTHEVIAKLVDDIIG